MRKIRIAQIGTSRFSHGNEIFNTLKSSSDIFELVGYAFPENEREKFPEHMEAFAGYREMSLDEILNDDTIEAVTVECEEIYLTKYALLAAKHGKHIHMEKPGSPALSEFEKLIEAVRDGGKVFHVGYMYRYNPFIRDAIDRAKKGELGEIFSVEAHMDLRHRVEERQWIKTFPGGMTFFLGCHLIDLILEIQGTPDRVIPLNKCTGIDGITGEDFGMTVFEYKNGYSFAKTTSAEHGGFQRRQLVITGSKGTVELRPLEQHVKYPLLFTGRRVVDDNGKSVEDRSDPFDRYESMMRSFASMVRGEAVNPYTLDYELELYKTVLMASGTL